MPRIKHLGMLIALVILTLIIASACGGSEDDSGSIDGRGDDDDDNDDDDDDAQPCDEDEDCDDGLFCNGEEKCINNLCASGDDPCPDDGLFCNGDEICDEENRKCDRTGDACPDDGEYCNGTEECNENTDTCYSTGNPCDDGEVCNEEADGCEVELSWDDDSMNTQLGCKPTDAAVCMFVNAFHADFPGGADILRLKIMFSSAGYGGSPPPTPYACELQVWLADMSAGPYGDPIYTRNISPQDFDTWEEFDVTETVHVNDVFAIGVGQLDINNFQSVGMDDSTSDGAWVSMDGITFNKPTTHGFPGTFMIRAVVGHLGKDGKYEITELGPVVNK